MPQMLPMIYAPEVLAARAEGRPIVALESTIITHGMPFPDNQIMAKRVEQDLRDMGVCPATIAVMEGNIHIGLTAQNLERLAKTKEAAKLSRADLAVCVAAGTTGATTVAATMICAAITGIKVFATGGIGGVHRGASESFDVSADLREFALSSVTVVCAGAKAILDLPKTFELLETYGVPVEEIQEGIKHGVRKINIDTDLRLASTGAIRRFLAKNPSEFDPRKYFKEATKAMTDIVKARYLAFGCEGQASSIRVVAMETMASRYLAGGLKPRVS